MTRSFLFLYLFCLLMVACSESEEIAPILPGDISSETLQSALVDFQWQLFQHTIQQASNEENVLISPFSVASALYMALEGAAAETKQEMMESLGLPYQEEESVSKAYHELVVRLLQIVDEVKLSSVNGVFYDQSRVMPASEFMSKMHDAFSADDLALDFSQPESRNQINNWVSDKTEGRIEEIVKEIKPEDIMFLINAIFLKADWANPFAPEQSYNDSFYRSDGTEQVVTFMTQDVYDNRFYKDADWQIVEKSFVDSTYSMVFVQPAQPGNLSDAIGALSVEKLDDLLNHKLAQGRILLHLPRFEVTYEKEMSEVLKEMGMRAAFAPGFADFSKLGKAGGNIYLSRVQHKTFLSVDEKGVEGAAVTSVGVSVTSLPPTFRFNRPYFYIIRNRATQTFVFVGRMMSVPQ